MINVQNLIYIPVEILVGKTWQQVGAFIDTGGTSNMARPSMFKGLWKPLKNILQSETLNGHIKITHYLDNVSLRIRGQMIKMNFIQYYDVSSLITLGMPFIEAVAPITLAAYRLICSFKKKVVSVPRLLSANTTIENKTKRVDN